MGTTTVNCSTARWLSSSAATRRANAVLPEPGVATARKSRGWPVRYFTSARRCQPRSDGGVLTGCNDTDPPVGALWVWPIWVAAVKFNTR